MYAKAAYDALKGTVPTKGEHEVSIAHIKYYDLAVLLAWMKILLDEATSR
jgi:hypothetical protein